MRPDAAPAQGNPLGTAPLGGLIRKFAIPSIIGMLVGAAYNITDQIFIGQVVGLLGNAATNVVFPLISLSIALAQMTGVGTAANFNLSLGARREDRARAFIGTGLTLTLIFGLGITLVVLLLETPILLLCGATETVLPYAQDYLGIVVYGLFFQVFTMAAGTIIRADRSPSYAMFSSVIGAVLNVFLDWLFLYPLGWGIRGAAAATVISQGISFLVCLAYFPRFKAFSLSRKDLRLRPEVIPAILKLGVSNFLNHLVMMLVNIAMNNTLTHYGALSIYGSDIPLAVSGVVAKVNMIMVSFAVGLAHGCQPILSFNMGAKNYPRVKATYRKAVAVGLVFSFCAFFLFQCFPRQIISIFGSGDPLYFEFAEDYLRIFMFMVCLFSIQPLSVNYFTSIGAVKQGIFLSVSRQGFLLLPLLAILPRFLGLDGVLYAGPAADLMAVILSLAMIRRSFRRLTALEKEAKETESLPS